MQAIHERHEREMVTLMHYDDVGNSLNVHDFQSAQNMAIHLQNMADSPPAEAAAMMGIIVSSQDTLQQKKEEKQKESAALIATSLSTCSNYLSSIQAGDAQVILVTDDATCGGSSQALGNALQGVPAPAFSDWKVHCLYIEWANDALQQSSTGGHMRALRSFCQDTGGSLLQVDYFRSSRGFEKKIDETCAQLLDRHCTFLVIHSSS